MSDQWFVHSNGEQMGPYTGEQLVQFGQEGSVTAETMVWAEGMPEWAPASEIPGLLPEAAAPAAAGAWAPPGSRLAAGGASSALGSSSTYGAQAAVDGEYPLASVKKASFGLWLGCLLGGFISFIIAFVLLFSGSFGAAATLFTVGSIALMMSSISFLINIYRAWYCLQPGGAQTTPGKAVGFMFIPLFQLYWVFVAINGLPKDWNRIVASYEDLKAAPKLGERTFLLYCIGIFVPPLAMVMIFPMMSQICKGINFFAARKNPNAPSTFSAFGGR